MKKPTPAKETDADDDWILKADPTVQLLLSVKLSAVAVPSWEGYALKNTMQFTDKASGKIYQLPPSFLAKALAQIRENSSVMLLYENRKYDNINRCLDEFTYPLTALNEGDWVLPRSARKIFTGVYNILKGMEQTGNPLSGYFFSVAISDLIDSIELNRLLTFDKLHSLLKEYKDVTTGREGNNDEN